jgi:hypothetical protein
MALCLIAIFKNESCIMKEWIEHYIKEGVDHFFLIDNASDDNYHQLLKEYIDSKKVTLITDSTRHKQRQLYNKYFLEKSKAYEWAMVCDLDEFIFSRKQYKTIKEYLSTVNPDISQVKVQWKIFGSNGLIEQPESVIKSFTKRIDYDSGHTQGVKKIEGKKYSLCKSIIRTKYLKEYNIHIHNSSNNNCIITTNMQSEMNEFAYISEDELDNSYLHLNHYVNQSLNWFMKVKATRGSAATIKNENIRNELYFKAYDINDKEDNELKCKLI